jgi:hypothetical protein
MHDDRTRWDQQFASNLGLRELARLATVVLGWILAGIALMIFFREPSWFAGSLAVLLVFSAVATRWQPAYGLLRRILGNARLPDHAAPSAHRDRPSIGPRPWWAYLPGLWFLLLDALIIVILVRYLLASR